MTAAFATDLLHHAVGTALMVAGPLLLTALLIGVIVSLMQAVTQIQEQSLTFIPKLLLVAVVFLLLLPWMMRSLVDFTVRIFQILPTAAQ